MRVLALALFVVSFIVQEICWHKAARFLVYRGESRIRRSRNLKHLSALHYRPEAKRWLFCLRVATVAMMATFIWAFWGALG
jgi:hypothetical protein